MKKTPSNKNKNPASNGEFLLNVRYQQHNSWQGSVQRLDTGETINFRSALELIYLIEDVAGQLAASEDKTHRMRGWRKSKEVDQTIHKNGISG